MTWPDRLVSTGEAARALGISRSTLSRWASEGRVAPAGRTVGRHFRWRVSDLERELDEIIGLG